jgi:hypothetical protein
VNVDVEAVTAIEGIGKNEAAPGPDNAKLMSNEPRVTLDLYANVAVGDVEFTKRLGGKKSIPEILAEGVMYTVPIGVIAAGVEIRKGAEGTPTTILVLPVEVTLIEYA